MRRLGHGLEDRGEIALVGVDRVQRWGLSEIVQAQLEDRTRRATAVDGVDDDEAVVTGDQIEHAEPAGPGVGDIDVFGRADPSDAAGDVDTDTVVGSHRVPDTEDQRPGHRLMISVESSVRWIRRRSGISPGRVWVAHARHGS